MIGNVSSGVAEAAERTYSLGYRRMEPAPAGPGGVLQMLGGALDSNKDGSALEDISGMIGRMCGRSLGDRVSLKEGGMSVAKVSEISATSSKSFEDAIQEGIVRASKTLRNVRGAWIKEQHVRCNSGKIVEYQVNMMVTFVLDD